MQESDLTEAPVKFVARFWKWYERHYALNLTITTLLFVLQLVHLYWLTTDVVFNRLFGFRFFAPNELWEYIIIVVDYTEIPALLSMSLLYMYQLRKKFTWKSVFFLIFLNSQWLHLFWITDEFVVNVFTGRGSVLPSWLAWIAILIDYLELPVIYDSLSKTIGVVRREGFVGLIRRKD